MSLDSLNPFNKGPEIIKAPTEKNDYSALFRDAQNKLEILDSFLATGDIISDYNYFLEITNRRINYKRATTESKEDLINNLKTILNSLEEEVKERENNIYGDEGTRVYYQEVPKTEIKVLHELLDYYK
ncbi:MAG: hypothetical protein WCK59_03100 [Candidatus Falkowbacteria bacterium]